MFSAGSAELAMRVSNCPIECTNAETCMPAARSATMRMRIGSTDSGAYGSWSGRMELPSPGATQLDLDCIILSFASMTWGLSAFMSSSLRNSPLFDTSLAIGKVCPSPDPVGARPCNTVRQHASAHGAAVTPAWARRDRTIRCNRGRGKGSGTRPAPPGAECGLDSTATNQTRGQTRDRSAVYRHQETLHEVPGVEGPGLLERALTMIA